MLSFFRNFFQSKIGMPIFLAFLVIVALAFAGGDITGNTFGGITTGERVAIVGDDEISTSELTTAAQSSLQGIQQENPTVTMPMFLAEGGLESILDQLINRYAIGNFAEMAGLRAGDNLVNSEIMQIPAFQGVNGEFSQAAYQAALGQQRMTDAMLRRDLSDSLLARQMILPALAAPQMPAKAAKQYAALLLERRDGKIALIPSALFEDDAEPSAKALETYYTDNRTDYIQPERRKLRFASFGASNIATDLSASDAEIAKRYEDTKDQYAASETRDVTSFFVPTEEGAKAIVKQVRGGKSLEAAASDAEFNTTSVEGRTQEEYAQSTSFAVAEAVFATPKGSIAEPARSTLGWYIARVDDITRTPARSLAQVRSEISEQIITEKRSAALAQLSAEIDERVDEGVSLTEIAKEFDLTIEESPMLLADGRVFGEANAQPNPAIMPILQTAFDLDESQPQLDELIPGTQFLVYDVAEIVQSEAPPLAEIKEQIAADYKRANASTVAKKTAQRILEKVRKDTSLAKALSDEGKPFPAPDSVSLTRGDLLQRRQGQNVPPALVLLFGMAEGTYKLLEAPANQGWILVELDKITSETLEDDSPLLLRARQQLAPGLANEYNVQLSRALREAVGVEKNDAAIEAVRADLAGES